MNRNDGRVTIENVRIIWKNFRGVRDQFNQNGDRLFTVIIEDSELARHLSDDGWLIRWLRPLEPGDPEVASIKVKVSYKKSAPRIVMITSKGRTTLGEGQLDLLDFADFRTADLTFTPYEWEANGKRGIKAYLRSLYVTIEEDPLENKYADIPERG